jgi:hypothetical protein
MVRYIYKARYYEQPVGESVVEIFNYPAKRLENFTEYVAKYVSQPLKFRPTTDSHTWPKLCRYERDIVCKRFCIILPG